MKKNSWRFVALEIAILFAGAALALVMSSGPHFPIDLWGGRAQIVARHRFDGHQAFHVVVAAEQEIGDDDLPELLATVGELALPSLKEDKGLYILAQQGDDLLFGVSCMSRDRALEIEEFVITYHWPEWVDSETIAWGYSWLLCHKHPGGHPWCADFGKFRPLPLDSDFMIAPDEGAGAETPDKR